jgi:hypothetical protein
MSGLGQEVIAKHLCEAIDRLQKDIEQVELWAAALNCFAQPVPDYEPDARHELVRRTELEKVGNY